MNHTIICLIENRHFKYFTRLWEPLLLTGGVTGATGAAASSSTLAGLCGRRTLPRTDRGASSNIGNDSTTSSGACLASTTAGAVVTGASSSTKMGASVGRVRAVLAGLDGRALVVRLVGVALVVDVVVEVVVTYRKIVMVMKVMENISRNFKECDVDLLPRRLLLPRVHRQTPLRLIYRLAK